MADLRIVKGRSLFAVSRGNRDPVVRLQRFRERCPQVEILTLPYYQHGCEFQDSQGSPVRKTFIYLRDMMDFLDVQFPA